ncbi:MAG: hypothetical protein Ct9H300mP2_0920 [Candidatus Neomarinimicrobiota bacterium]|nr:MAG: hypothetical protein Ct9H300mP2_0920 [Candidatus Neomarinimicrobiota bacterium]
MVRTGIGYDVHQLAAGEKLVIGGIEIPGLSGSVGIPMVMVLFML